MVIVGQGDPGLGNLTSDQGDHPQGTYGADRVLVSNLDRNDTQPSWRP